MEPDHARLHELLRTHFGYTEFRTKQIEAIQGTLSCRDVLLVLPTGGGKSLAFQLPSLVTQRLTVVITPLLALAYDQVQNLLDNHDIEAASWSSSTSDARKEAIVRDIVDDAGSLRLLYTTPESIFTDRLLDALRIAHALGRLCSLAIDEAHTCVVWGHSFRESYLSLGKLRGLLPGLPCVAVTATATQDVRKGIIDILLLRDPLVLLSSFNRPELRFCVRHKELVGDASDDAVTADLVQFVKHHSRSGQTGIVYCRKRVTCDRIAAAFCNSGIEVAAYHAGLDSRLRTKAQREWKEGCIDVVVATIAFGMGVDVAHVRWVVHFDPPASLEGLYQEAGRAGRDGKPADCVIYFSNDDLRQAQRMEGMGAGAGDTSSVASFLQEAVCRRQALLRHFGERRRGPCCAADGEQLCDFCADPRLVASCLASVEARLMSVGSEHAQQQQQQQQQRGKGGRKENAGGIGDGVGAEGEDHIPDPYDTHDAGERQEMPKVVPETEKDKVRGVVHSASHQPAPVSLPRALRPAHAAVHALGSRDQRGGNGENGLAKRIRRPFQPPRRITDVQG